MQTFLATILILLACSYLGWQFYRRFFAKETKCDGCAVGQISQEVKNSK